MARGRPAESRRVRQDPAPIPTTNSVLNHHDGGRAVSAPGAAVSSLHPTILDRAFYTRGPHAAGFGGGVADVRHRA